MTDNKGVEFNIFAPYNETVALIGDWNKWQPTTMERGDDGWWRVYVPLKDGEYQYKFQVKSNSYFAKGETLTVPDPRAVCVSEDEHENACIRIKNGQRVITDYKWQHDDKPLPQNHELIIYEMLVSDFSGGIGDENSDGKFQDVIDKLDYLVELGINAIELMPVTEFPGDHSWGYNTRVLYAIENSYGSPNELCKLVDECHARGIRVILDQVYNHSEMDSPLAKIDYAYWYYEQNPDKPEIQFGPKFNYNFFDENLKIHPARDYVRDAIRFWIEHFHVDGIRFDATYVINNYEVLHWLRDEINVFLHGIKPFLAIAEHVPEDPTVTGSTGPLDAAWQDTFCKTIIATLMEKDHDGSQPYNLDAILAVIDPRRRGYESPLNVVNYLDNHDQNRVMWLLGEAGFIDDPAFRRNKLGASLLFTAPGLPMVWMGGEFGECAPRTTDRQQIDWALLQNERNQGLRNHYASLAHLRFNTPALKLDTIEFTQVDRERCIIAFKRWNNDGNVVLVVANLRDVHAGEVEIGFPYDGAWHEHIYNYDVEVQGNVLRDTLAESEVKIYIKR